MFFASSAMWRILSARSLACTTLTFLAAANPLVAWPAIAADLRTPLETSSYQNLPKSVQIDTWLEKLAHHLPGVRKQIIGRSALGNPVSALFISGNGKFTGDQNSSNGRIVVMLTGSQHGTEPAGGAALQIVARELAVGKLRHFLKDMTFIIVPLANPDGRDINKRNNGAGINLSTDFLALSQPESRALVSLMHSARPHVFLDVHESAILKRRSLGAQGYMTSFEAQFETATNPNVAHRIRRFASRIFLPSLLRETARRGVPATRYIGEITDVGQTITHGGTTLRNIRNYASTLGILSVLLENRLDPPGVYATPRNILVRVGKQRRSIEAFIEITNRHRRSILRTVAEAREQTTRIPQKAELAISFGINQKSSKRITLRLIERASGKLVEKQFQYAPKIKTNLCVRLPSFLAIRAHQTQIAELLKRHSIETTKLERPKTVEGKLLLIEQAQMMPRGTGKIGSILSVQTRPKSRRVALKRGDLLVDLSKPFGFIAPLLLDPRSSNPIYREAGYRDLLQVGREHFIIAIP